MAWLGPRMTARGEEDLNQERVWWTALACEWIMTRCRWCLGGEGIYRQADMGMAKHFHAGVGPFDADAGAHLRLSELESVESWKNGGSSVQFS